MKTLTKRQILNFIRKQPADRPVNLMNPRINPQLEMCGCVLCHYMVDELGIDPDLVAANAYKGYVRNECKDKELLVEYPLGVFSINHKTFFRQTYGDLQRLNPPRPKRPSERKK